MKILVIRGQNLASLGGDFEVDLTAEPLMGEGLFAITGQTGSGKSTLLDAMCLALFGKTPRLSQRSTGSVGRDEEDKKRQAGSSDPRTVLRRGSGSGFAEVEFLGVDDRIYRSRWSVRRSRNKPEGRLQKVQLEVWDQQTTQRIDDDKKTNTLATIAERLGLDFDQFRRSVLLPQGEFAAFLKANEADRGALLERMTGTEIYRRISTAAFQRAREERVALTRLQEQVDLIGTLEVEEVARIQSEQEERKARELVLRGELQAAEQAARWHGRLAELLAEEAVAEGELQAAEQALTLLEPVKEELAAIAAVEALRPLLASAERASVAVEAAQAEQARLEVTHAVQKASTAEAQEADVEAAAALGAAREQQESMGAALAEAAELDVRISSASRELITARRHRGEATESAEQVRVELAALQARITTAEQSIAEQAAWLSAHPELVPLAEGWASTEKDLRQAVEALSARVDAVKALALRVSAEEAARSSHQAAEVAAAAAQAALVPLKEALAIAEAALSGRSSVALQARREALYTRRRALDQLTTLRRELLEVDRKRTRQLAQAESLRAESERCQQAAEAAAKLKERSRWMLEEAERLLEQVRAEEVLTGRREALRDGEPCPLCGAREHPWASAPRPLASLFESSSGRVKQLREEINSLELRQRQSTVEQASHAAAAQEAAAEAAVQVTQVATLHSAWTDRAEQLALPAPESAGEALAAAQTAVAQELDENQSALEELSRLQAAAESARSRHSAARAGQDAAVARLHQGERTSEAAARQREAAEIALARLDERRSHALSRLAEPLEAVVGWKTSFEDDPAGFSQRITEQVERCIAARRAVAAGRAVLEEQRPEREARRALLTEREERVSRATALELEKLSVLKELQERRHALLGGQETAAVRAGLRRKHEQAEVARQRTATVLAASREHLAELTARLAAAGAETSRRQQELTAARQTLEQALQEQGRALEDVRQRLSRPQGWVAEQRAALDAASNTARRAAVICAERQRLRSLHQGSDLPPLAAADAAERIASVSKELEALRSLIYQTRARLEQDARNRKLAEDLIIQRDVQRACWEHWEVMNKLIGSASGRNFSQFAQSLTLDALLIQANSHLSSLSRRYSLMRVPGEDLMLQIVDHYHGEEVRSINSLSGGESFLVSLALALGLATLSARDTQIGSLFIDEGFGSLDPDTLDVALSSLDALQASGRQVGLISHVPGMAERIGVQVQVVPRGGGRSVIRVVGGA